MSQLTPSFADQTSKRILSHFIRLSNTQLNQQTHQLILQYNGHQPDNWILSNQNPDTGSNGLCLIPCQWHFIPRPAPTKSKTTAAATTTSSAIMRDTRTKITDLHALGIRSKKAIAKRPHHAQIMAFQVEYPRLVLVDLIDGQIVASFGIDPASSTMNEHEMPTRQRRRSNSVSSSPAIGLGFIDENSLIYTWNEKAFLLNLGRTVRTTVLPNLPSASLNFRSWFRSEYGIKICSVPSTSSSSDSKEQTILVMQWDQQEIFELQRELRRWKKIPPFIPGPSISFMGTLGWGVWNNGLVLGFQIGFMNQNSKGRIEFYDCETREWLSIPGLGYAFFGSGTREIFHFGIRGKDLLMIVWDKVEHDCSAFVMGHKEWKWKRVQLGAEVKRLEVLGVF